MTDSEFSRPGAPPTQFEVRLLQAAAGDGAWLMVARSLMQSLGPELGAAALLTVLDELGTEKVHVPTRGALIQALFRPLRNARVLEMVDRHCDLDEIGRALNIHPELARHIAKRSGRRSGLCRGKRRA